MCNAAISPNDINTETGFAKCPSCGHIMHLHEPPLEEPPVEDDPPPGTLVVDRTDPNILTVQWSWMKFPGLFVGTFIGVCFVMVLMLGAALRHGGSMPILLIILGATMLYFFLAQFLNTTTVRLDATTLSVRIRPIPWFGNWSAPAESIQRFYWVKRSSGAKGRGAPIFELKAVLNTSAELSVLTTFSSVEIQYVQNALKKRLGLIPNP